MKKALRADANTAHWL